MSCCEPVGSSMKEVGECVECGNPVDAEGDSTEVCAWSPVECDSCGWSPCNESC